ncbi:MAG: calcium-binding protein [Cyanobacteria bacterium P01_B01_bin.77]
MTEVTRGHNSYGDVLTAYKTRWGGLAWDDWEMYGQGGNDVLTGGKKGDYIDGGTGRDRMVGLDGNDRYIVDNVGDTVIESANKGTDSVYASVSFSLSNNVENLYLTGNSNINGYGNSAANRIEGNNQRNFLYGRAGNDTLQGHGGNDVLDGGAGADNMYGGVGHDTYVVDHVNDGVYDLAIAGDIDTVEAAINNYQLGDHIEILKLRSTPGVTTGRGNNQSNSIFGNVYNNTLYGNGGNDYLRGKGGSDRLLGGAGHDVLVGMDFSQHNEIDELTGGSGNDTFQLHNNGSTYRNTGFAIIKDFQASSVWGTDTIELLGNESDYVIDKTQNYLGSSARDTLIWKGTNLIGVVEDTTQVFASNIEYTGS